MNSKITYPTAEELRAEMETPNAAGERLNTEGLNYEVIANAIAKTEKPEGWDAPRVLPTNWREVQRSADGTTAYQSFHVRVLLSCSIELDGRAWLHLSISTRERIPNWQEIGHAKRTFLGDREAYQVIPPKARYVNINERVLHVFALLDESQTALPDFTRGTNSL
jgi:hypothetical protein